MDLKILTDNAFVLNEENDDCCSTVSDRVTCDDSTLDRLSELHRLRGSLLCDRIQHEFGTVDRLCERLIGTSPQTGLANDQETIDHRKKIFGCNLIQPKPMKSFFRFIWEAFNDVTLIILTVSAAVSLGLSFYHAPPIIDENGEVVPDPTKGLEWIEGMAILVAVVVIVLVTAFSNWSKDRQFRNLKKTIDNKQMFATIRSGESIQVHVADLVVGDVCQVKYGDTIPADGLIIQSNDLRLDESSLTGESAHVKKNQTTDPLLFSGTHVMEGSGRMAVIAVGINTEYGKIMQLLVGSKKKKINGNDDKSDQNNDDDDDDDDDDDVKSLLRTKLDKIAMRIGYAGIVAALLTLSVLIIRFCIDKFVIDELPWNHSYIQDFVSFIIISITILVVAIPEGLPLAVMLSLAYSVKKMMDDNNLVRHLDACETMGSATCICSDKTGTLTSNRMTVVNCHIAGKSYNHTNRFQHFPEQLKPLLATAIAVNTGYTSSVLKQSNSFISRQTGNKTECSLLGFLLDIGVDYEQIRRTIPEDKFHKVYTFSSIRKWMSVVIPRGEDGYRLFIKGASEIVIKKCQWIVDAEGHVVSFPATNGEEFIRDVIDPMAGLGQRTLCIAYKDFVPAEKNGDAAEYEVTYNKTLEPNWDDEEQITSDLVCLCIVGIEDPVRPEVPNAIASCQKAGITVRMVTGDNVKTARSIAMKCGILVPHEDFLVMEGPEFNSKIRSTPDGPVSQELLDRIWPRLRVLARSSPDDKYNLVKGIMESHLDANQEVVAVTGDGTNDGPALKKADVGFAMGVTGTDVAKEASDIILIDDNFASIVKAVVWGRGVYDSIAKFLQFQLTVNVVAVSIAFLSACAIADTPIKAVQMMWVNLLQDTLASLSLSTERPTEELLRRKPYGRNQSIVSTSMIVNILLHSAYQLTVLLCFLFLGDEFLDVGSGLDEGMRGVPNQHFTFIFNVLVMMTMFNEFNCRKLDGSFNVFSRLQQSHLFIVIWISSFIFQVIIIQFGGYAFFTTPLTADQWLWCLFFGAGELIFYMVLNGVELLTKKLRRSTPVTAAMNSGVAIVKFFSNSTDEDQLIARDD